MLLKTSRRKKRKEACGTRCAHSGLSEFRPHGLALEAKSRRSSRHAPTFFNMNGMREIICPICGGADKTVVYESRLSPAFDETTPPSPYSSHYRINRCACGLLYSSPIMDRSE